MASDVSIVIADPTCMPVIRETASIPGRLMPFAANSLGSAMESIRAYRPKVVAIDAVVAQTPAGVTFLERVEQLAIPKSKILLLVEADGHWVTTPRSNAPTPGPSKSGASAAPQGQPASKQLVMP